jgi:hypothetical protein
MNLIPTTRWLTFALVVASTLCFQSLAYSFQDANKSIREFDKKMVATPAELFEALKTLQPDSHIGRKPKDTGLSEIEKAGLEFFSKLSTEQQEELWDTAGQYLRKNGVDSSASKAIMDEIGIPGDIQEDLKERFKDFQNSRSGRTSKQNREAISDLLEQAKSRSLRGGKSSNLGLGETDPGKVGSEPSEGADPSNATGAGGNNQRPLNGGTASNAKQPQIPKSRIEEVRRAMRQERERLKRLGNRSANSNRKNRSEELLKENRFGDDLRKGISQNRTLDSGDFEVDKGKRESESDLGGQRSEPRGVPTLPDSNSEPIDWQKSFKDLLERHSDGQPSSTSNNSTLTPERRAQIRENFEQFTNGDALNPKSFKREGLAGQLPEGLNPDMIKKVKEAYKSFSKRDRDSGAGSKERPTARFDKMLAKAAKRALESDPGAANVELPDAFDSMLDKMVDQAKDTLSKKRTTEREAERQLANRRNGASDQDWSNMDSDFFSETDGGNDGSQAQRSRQRNSLEQGTGASSNSSSEFPKITAPKFSPKDMLDRMPDLSGINPKHVFIIVGVIGGGLLLIYLLMQALVGDSATAKSRRANKRLRKATINSPKDLVEAVDVFLVDRFGAQSSWWTDRHARLRLNSDAPEFKSKTNELLKEYVRARYMRSEVRLSDAEQRRYKQLLQELANVSATSAKENSASNNPVLATTSNSGKG